MKYYTLDRPTAAALALETVRILDTGRYTHPDSGVVRVRRELEAAVASRVDVLPDSDTTPLAAGDHATRFEVVEETTLAAARRVFEREGSVCALNFASGHNPGGGFLKGARAQEESLCRASALWHTIRDSPMYAHHGALGSPAYSDWIVLSNDVPVIRDDSGALLARPWLASFATCAAPNARRMIDSGSRPDDAHEALDARIERLLEVLAAHGHAHLVLGAWGCGVFRNDPERVAESFSRVLSSAPGAFGSVTFAILDETRRKKKLTPFVTRFR